MAVPPQSHSITQDKQRLRVDLRRERAAFARGRTFLVNIDQSAFAAGILAKIDAAHVIAGYWPVGSEADIRPLLDRVRALGKVVALPRFDFGSGDMAFHAWAGPDDSELYQGYLVPRADAPIVTPDLILAPLIAFDRKLNRLGQGGGFYDRAFARYPRAMKVGVTWSAQEVEAVPVERHDQPLDAILTECEWITNGE